MILTQSACINLSTAETDRLFKSVAPDSPEYPPIQTLFFPGGRQNFAQHPKHNENNKDND